MFTRGPGDWSLALSPGLCLGQVIRAQEGESRSVFRFSQREGRSWGRAQDGRALSEAELRWICFASRSPVQALPPGPAQLPRAPGESGDHSLPGASGCRPVPLGEAEIREVF